MPIERRTTAPAPSDCSRARKENLMARGVVMLLEVGVVMVARLLLVCCRFIMFEMGLTFWKIEFFKARLLVFSRL